MRLNMGNINKSVCHSYTYVRSHIRLLESADDNYLMGKEVTRLSTIQK